MKNIMDKLKIIGLKEHGFSNRTVAKMVAQADGRVRVMFKDGKSIVK